MKVYKPKKWLTVFRFICLLSVCILINGITFNYEKEIYKTNNKNLTKNVEQKVLEDEKLAEEIKKQEESKIIIEENTKYISKEEIGFKVTTNNRIYELSYEDFVLLAAVIASEANRSSEDDVLAVSSVILNRADENGGNPIDVITARGQFSGYLGGYYQRYIDENGNLINVSDSVIDTIHDALNGTRNNNYFSFNSWSTSGYSENYIVEGGNRYR